MINYSKINQYLTILLVIFSFLLFGLLFFAGKMNFAYIAMRALVSPDKNGLIVVNGQSYNFVLPQKTTLLEENVQYKRYLTLTSGADLFQKYYYHDLPVSGWTFVEQLGSSYIFQNGKATLISTRRRVFHRFEEITYSIDIKSNNIEKVVALK